MGEQILKDRSNRIIGRITQRSDGKLEIKDAQFRIKGTYDPKRDETKDERFRLVGKGNLLTTLL